jgi:hypothetical protein
VVTLRTFVVKYLRDIATPGLGMAAANDDKGKKKS